jgi:regulator of nonsense transcripts 2
MRGRLSPHAIVIGGPSPLQEERDIFERSKKSLKSDLKKCTAFVKKIKAGQYPAPKELDMPNSALRTLNLSRYVEEVAGAIMEPIVKVKQSGELPSIVTSLDLS